MALPLEIFRLSGKIANDINPEYVSREKIYALLPLLWHICIKHQDTVKSRKMETLI